MSAGSPAGEDLSDEDRVLRCIDEHAEGGISTFAITSELHLNAKAVAPIVDRLEREMRIHGEKRGFIFYWKPGPDPGKARPEDEDGLERIKCPMTSCDSMILADRGHMGSHLNTVHGNLPPRERSEMLDKVLPRQEGPTLEDLKAELEAMPDVVTSSTEGADSIKCPVPGCGCKNQGKRALDNMFTHLKVKHGLERAEARRLYDLPWNNAPSGTKEAARLYCRHPGCTAGPFPDGRKRHGHESFCKHNPKVISKAKGKASRPSMTTDASSIKEEVQEPPCDGDGCTIALPRPVSLEEFAELHRRRLRKDIRMMKRAEKRLARRSACALGMMSRIREARAIKERELRRFDRELEEVSRADHPRP